MTGRVQRIARWWRAPLPQVSGFEATRYLAKWIVLGSLIGVVAGLGAVALSAGIRGVTELFLGRWVGYLPPAPVGEGRTDFLPMARPWLLPLVTGLGGLLSGILVFRLAPEAEGHGTDAAIDAIHHRGARIRARIPLVKLVASAITIGSGGSGGREGPTAQISAGFGSLLGRWLKLSPQDRRIAVVAGIGAGVGAIFRAPLGGAVMGAEVLYTHDLEVEALLPSLISAIVGYTVYGVITGFEPLFGPHLRVGLGSPLELPYYALLGLLCGAVGVLYARTFYAVADGFRKLRIPAMLKPALGGVAVGLLGLVAPAALHTGYGWVQEAMDRGLVSVPLRLVLLLPFAKILATALSIGSGGSGGVFGPGIVVGGLVGVALWRLLHGALPHVPASPAPFVIAGMMALFGGIAHAPLAVMLMVAEMTGNLSLLAPAMIAVAVATALVGDGTIYRSQLLDRSHAPLHRVRLAFPLLASLRVQDAMQPNAHGGTSTDVAVRPDQPLDEALAQLLEAEQVQAPVVDDGRVVGVLHARDVLRVYRELAQAGIRMTPFPPGPSRSLEATVPTGSPLVGHTLREAGLPPGVLVVAILRDGEVIFPKADTVLQAGDRLTVLVDPDNPEVWNRWWERLGHGLRER
ncbi:MAG: chloride channel protein [Armatimonadota bacterium]|nr:chloride channel protein [Armatimonadota bacterium]MDR7445196.1 chloride channel protein [Armatimonadota bacterium]MDR7571095.1 chloride channel protein [Armatimonadota bacterium]MDR7613703.1 chloride channel protein [Armatimonadota bacterium]